MNRIQNAPGPHRPAVRRTLASAILALCVCLQAHALYYITLDKQLANCEAFLAGDVSAYPAALLEELRDAHRYALVVRSDATVSQSQITACASLLKTKLAAVQAQEGFVLGDTLVAQGPYDTDRGFVHPGLLHTQADIERIQAQLADSDAFVTEAYGKLTSNVWAQLTTTVAANDTVVRTSSGGNFTTVSRAANAAYMCALRWLLGGNEAYAEHAVELLNDWAATCKAITGDTNYALAAGLTGYQFANAAELLRDYEGWDEQDFQDFLQWMRQVWYEANIGFLRRRNGTWQNEDYDTGECPGHYWSNWGLCNVLSAMSIGILCDDPFLYNQAVSFYKYNHFDYGDNAWPCNKVDGVVYDQGCNEFLGLLVVETSEDARGPLGQLGQMQESGRDQAHAALALGLAVDICQTAFNQGDDLFAYMDNRLAAGIEWHMAFNTQDSLTCSTLPWTPFHTRGCRYLYTDSRSELMTEPSYAGRYALRCYNERILGYYEGVKGIHMPYTTFARDSLGMEEGGQYTGTGDGHLGLTTLTCHREAVSPAHASATLKGHVIHAGDTLTDQTELGGLKATWAKKSSTAIEAGSEVRLVAELPDSLAGTGTWEWSTGETGVSAITVFPERSSHHIARYTNALGVESSVAFTLAVKGDCRPDSLTPTMASHAVATSTGVATEAETTTGDTLTVLAGASLVLRGTAPSARWGYYAWETGASVDSILVEQISRSRDYTLVYTNPGGAQTRRTYHIGVVAMEACVQVDSNAVQACATASVVAGQRVRLIPRTTESYSLGRWAWYEGEAGVGACVDTTQVLSLDSVVRAGRWTVVHTYGDLADTLTFAVDLATAATLTDGDYRILAADSDEELFLGVRSTMTVGFAASDEDEPSKQLWTIELDSTVNRHRITSAYSGRALNGNGRLVLPTSYRAATCTFALWRGTEEDCYAVQNSAESDGTYWHVDGTDLCLDGASLDGFPFRIVLAEDYSTGIQAPACEAAHEAAGVRYYSLSGMRLASPQKGLCIVRTVDGMGNVRTSKCLF